MTAQLATMSTTTTTTKTTRLPDELIEQPLGNLGAAFDAVPRGHDVTANADHLARLAAIVEHDWGTS